MVWSRTTSHEIASYHITSNPVDLDEGGIAQVVRSGASRHCGPAPRGGPLILEWYMRVRTCVCRDMCETSTLPYGIVAAHVWCITRANLVD